MSHIYCMYHARTKTTTMISLWEKLFHHTVMTQTFNTRECQHSNVLPLNCFSSFFFAFWFTDFSKVLWKCYNNRINRSVLKISQADKEQERYQFDQFTDSINKIDFWKNHESFAIKTESIIGRSSHVLCAK